MSTNLPANFTTIIGRKDIKRYYAVRGSAPSDVAIVSLRGKPDEPAFTRKGNVQHDPSLHGRITARSDSDTDLLAWREWVLTQPRTQGKWKAPKVTPAPEAITLADVCTVSTVQQVIILDDFDAHRDNTCPDKDQTLPAPKLADVMKAGSLWVIANRRDLGVFTSRDKARAAVRACK